MPRGLNLHIFGIRSIYRFGMMTFRNQYTPWHAKSRDWNLYDCGRLNPVNADSLWINRDTRKSIGFENRESSCWNYCKQFIRKNIARI